MEHITEVEEGSAPPARQSRRTPAVQAPQAAPARTMQTMTPMDMLATAVQRGASVDELGKLWEIAEKVRQQQAQQAFVSAMNVFKQNPPSIEKTRTANVTRKDGGAGHSYKYANLADVCAAVVRALSAAGISHSWSTVQEGGQITVRCTLTHEQGHAQSTMLVAGLDTTGSKNNLQALGSTVSYLERYTLLAVCGLAIDDEQDDDGASVAERDELRQLAGEVREKAPVSPLMQRGQEAADKGHMALGDFLRSITEAERRTLAPALNALQQRASGAKAR